MELPLTTTHVRYNHQNQGSLRQNAAWKGFGAVQVNWRRGGRTDQKEVLAGWVSEEVILVLGQTNQNRNFVYQ